MRATQSSPERIHRLFASLDTSYQEMQIIGDSLMNRSSYHLANQAELAEIGSDAEPILNRVNHQFGRLKAMTERFTRESNGSWIKQWYHWSQFVLMQQELVNQIAEKDQLMEDLRRVQDRYVSLCQFYLPSSRLM